MLNSVFKGDSNVLLSPSSHAPRLTRSCPGLLRAKLCSVSRADDEIVSGASQREIFLRDRHGLCQGMRTSNGFKKSFDGVVSRFEVYVLKLAFKSQIPAV
jgi:hypothetical protein